MTIAMNSRTPWREPELTLGWLDGELAAATEQPTSSRESILVRACLILGGIAATGAVALMGAAAL